MKAEKGKVIGIGGIFFKCKDPQKLKEWYQTHLGFTTDQYGALFGTEKSDVSGSKAYLQWSPFKDDTTYFEPSKKEFMINYRVDDLEVLQAKLRDGGVSILDEIETFEYGKFLHILDIEGNKIELWEPIDTPFDDYPSN